MFTGIVEEMGRVAAFTGGASGWKLRVEARQVTKDVALGDSVAVNGCCLTVVESDVSSLTFDLLAETMRLTNFERLAPGASVNLESSLRANGKIGGHFVSGHIDGLGTIVKVEAHGPDRLVQVRAPEGSGRLLVPKGSIAVDGVSLTVAETSGDLFSIWLIPHTLAVTTLGQKRPDDLVNLEFDLLGKYVAKLVGTLRG